MWVLPLEWTGTISIFRGVRRTASYIRTLYSIPVFGGTPRAMIRDVDSAPSFSPDGQRFVFLRQTPELKDHFSEMHVVNADLSGDVIVYQGIYPASFPNWSPDGKKIAWNELKNGRETYELVYDVESKQTRTLSPAAGLNFYIYQAWMPDSSSLVTTYYKDRSDLFQVGLAGYFLGADQADHQRSEFVHLGGAFGRWTRFCDYFLDRGFGACFLQERGWYRSVDGQPEHLSGCVWPGRMRTISRLSVMDGSTYTIARSKRWRRSIPGTSK